MAEQTDRPRRRRAPTDSPRPRSERANGQHPRRLSTANVARAAMAEIAELTGHDVEGVISVERNDDGWKVGVEVVESHRIPDSADILATYEVHLDEDGELFSYRRNKRYLRGQTFGGRGER
jgi:hypothetical protein